MGADRDVLTFGVHVDRGEAPRCRHGVRVLKKLFNDARAHFNPVGGRLVGTGKAREFFVQQGVDNSETQRWWFRLQSNMRRTITERMVRVSSKSKGRGVFRKLTLWLLHTEWFASTILHVPTFGAFLGNQHSITPNVPPCFRNAVVGVCFIDRTW